MVRCNEITNPKIQCCSMLRQFPFLSDAFPAYVGLLKRQIEVSKAMKITIAEEQTMLKYQHNSSGFSAFLKTKKT
jgi:hypothetical protein